VALWPTKKAKSTFSDTKAFPEKLSLYGKCYY
jgi:hypothetical protein